jgi:hypothetical protein
LRFDRSRCLSTSHKGLTMRPYRPLLISFTIQNLYEMGKCQIIVASASRFHKTLFPYQGICSKKQLDQRTLVLYNRMVCSCFHLAYASSCKS